VGDHADRSQHQRLAKRYILVEHARNLIAQEEITSEASDQEHNQLERSRQLDVGSWELHGVLHLRYDLGQHVLASQSEAEGASSFQDAKYGEVGHGLNFRTPLLDLLRAVDHKITKWNQHCATQGDDVDPHQTLIMAHLSGSTYERKDESTANDHPRRQAKVRGVKDHAKASARAEEVDPHQTEDEGVLRDPSGDDCHSALELARFGECPAAEPHIRPHTSAGFAVDSHLPEQNGDVHVGNQHQNHHNCAQNRTEQGNRPRHAKDSGANYIGDNDTSSQECTILALVRLHLQITHGILARRRAPPANGGNFHVV